MSSQQLVCVHSIGNFDVFTYIVNDISVESS